MTVFAMFVYNVRRVLGMAVCERRGVKKYVSRWNTTAPQKFLFGLMPPEYTNPRRV
jgi:hypothetical protein